MIMKPIQMFISRNFATDEDVSTYVKEGNKLGIDFDFYLFIRTLEHNDKFVKWVEKLRKEANLPVNGIDCRENPLLIGFKNAKDIDEKFLYTFKKEDFEYLLKMLPFMYRFTLEAVDWGTLIVSNAIRLPFGNRDNLHISPSKTFLETKVNYSFEITFNRNFTKEELHKLIDSSWYWMKMFIPKKQKVEVKDFKLNERDVFLLNARDFQKLRFNEIADKLEESFPKEDMIYTEDSAKKAYHRANYKAKMSFNEKNNISIDSEIFSKIAQSFVQK